MRVRVTVRVAIRVRVRVAIRVRVRDKSTLGVEIFLNNFFCKGVRDFKSGLIVTNKGAADPLVPSLSF